MATTFTDATAGRVTAWPLQGRTDENGSEITGEHFDGKDAGVLLAPYTEGVLTADAFQVVEDSPAGMTVVVGSGSIGDKAILVGTESLQPVYGVAWPDATTDITVPAADLSNPRIDEVYLVVQDDQYDSDGNVLPRLALRDGTPASSPSAPGPDSPWTAFLLLATITVGAGVTEIEDTDITDERVFATSDVDVAANRVQTASIDDGAVTDAKLATGAVTTEKIASNAVTTAKYAPDSVDTTALAPLSVSTGALANVAVTTGKIADANVTTAKIADANVTGVKAAGSFFQSFQVDGYAEVASASIPATLTTVATVNLSIPAGWGSWRCHAIATFAYETLTNVADTFTALVAIDGTGPQALAAVVGSNNTAARIPGSVVARRTGMTTTGARTVLLRVFHTAGTVNTITDINFYAQATRLT